MTDLRQARWMIIANPAAANGRVARIWPQLELLFNTYLPHCSYTFSERAGHATTLAAEAIREGFRHLIAVGGDGTNHEVTNGILQQDIVPSEEVYYSLLPVGTGNDWARNYQIPHNPEAWLHMLILGHCRQQDVGVVKYQTDSGPAQRYFVNVAGMAYDAFVVRFGEQHRSWVRNRIFYLLLILRCLFRYRLSPGVIETDGRVIQQHFYTINVGVCRYSGGGMQLVPQAIPDDGLLALTYAGRVSKLGVLLNTWRFYNGSIGRHPKIETTQAIHLHVDVPVGEAALLLEADGEFLGQSPVEFSLKAKALKIIIPATGK